MSDSTKVQAGVAEPIHYSLWLVPEEVQCLCPVNRLGNAGWLVEPHPPQELGRGSDLDGQLLRHIGGLEPHDAGRERPAGE